MEILFDEDDLEPAQAGQTDASAPAAALETSEASLFGDLEEALGLEPVFAPAPLSGAAPVSRTPVADLWGEARAAAAKALRPARTGGAAVRAERAEPPAPAASPEPDGSLFPEIAPAERAKPRRVVKAVKTVKPAKPRKASGSGDAPKAEAPESFVECSEDWDGARIIRTPGDAEAFNVLREDGTVVEVDRDSCADSGVFERERRRRRASDGRRRPAKSILTRAIDALSRREYSRRDLGRKLAQNLAEGETREQVTETLDRLESLGLLSDERYAEAKVRAAAGRMGDYRLRRELRMSGVSEERIDAALETVEEPEDVRALRMWRRRWSEPPENWREREKMTRYLLTRGFGMSAISRVLRGEVELPEDEV